MFSMVGVTAELETLVKIDGEMVVFNEDLGKPFIDENNRTQVPFRTSMNAIDATVEWDQANQTAIATKGDIRIEVPIGESYIQVNGVEKANDTESVIVSNRTYLPIRIVMESFGLTVSWDGANRTVVVESGSMTTGEVQKTFGIRHDLTLADYEALANTTSTDRPDFSGVVAFTYSLDGSSEASYTATGTLIAPQWILTAGHNFFVATEQSEPATAAGIKVNFGSDPNSPTATYGVEKNCIPSNMGTKQ